MADSRDWAVEGRWLREQSAPVASTIACRAALRALPILQVENQSSQKDHLSRLLLLAFRATTATWAALRYVNARRDQPSDSSILGNLLSHSSKWGTIVDQIPTCVTQLRSIETTIRYSNVAYVVSAIAEAATCAYGIFREPKSKPINTAVRALASTNAAFGTNFGRSALVADKARFEVGGTTDQILDSALWQTERGIRNRAYWNDLRSFLMKDFADWDVWIRWYEARLNGAASPGGMELDLFRVCLDQGIWQAGHKVANLEIRNREDQFNSTAELSDKLAAAALIQQSTTGAIWIASGEQFVIDPSGSSADIEATEDHVVKQLFESVSEKAKQLRAKSLGVEDRIGWTEEGFEGSVVKFCEILDDGLERIPARIARAYDAVITLASYLDLDDNLRAYPSGNMGCLPPDVRRTLADLVRTSALWVRQFPTAQDLDDQLGSFLEDQRLYRPSIEIIGLAKSGQMIPLEDAELVFGLLRIAATKGDLSKKAGTRGVASTRNLIIAALTAVALWSTKAVLDNYAEKSRLVEQAGDFLVARESEVVELFSKSASDIRITVKEFLEELRKRNRGRDSH